MTDLLAVLGLAVLFVVFGAGAGRSRRSGCACGDPARACGHCHLRSDRGEDPDVPF